jgi:hypothetical protein
MSHNTQRSDKQMTKNNLKMYCMLYCIVYNIHFIQTYKKGKIMAITKQDIFDAADAIQASGIKPTMAAVRERLGGGSLSTISPALREWVESGNKIVAVIVDLPPEVKTIVEKMGGEIWKSLSAITNDKILRIETDATLAINEAFKDRDTALTEVQKLEIEIEKLLTCKLNFESKNNSLELQIEKQQIMIDSQITKIDELKADCSVALFAEKIAIEKAASLNGKLEFVLQQNKSASASAPVQVVQSVKKPIIKKQPVLAE